MDDTYNQFNFTAKNTTTMKRRLRKLRDSTQNSFDELSFDELSQDYVEQKRKSKKTKSKPKGKSKTTSTNEMFEQESQEQIDIHTRGGDFRATHTRPAFMQRWDKESNMLELTSQEWDSLSPMFKVYWKNKTKNMKCVIFLQLGRVEFLAFEDDAILLHQMFKKPLKKYSKFLMVNFWSKEIQLAKIELFERKIPVLMLNQLDDKKYQEEFSIMRREITEVITPGVHLGVQPKDFNERLLLGVFGSEEGYGVVCVDVESNIFYVEQLDDQKPEKNIHQMRRIINRYRPVQLVIQKGNQLTKKMAKQICNPYIVELELDRLSFNEKFTSMQEISSDPLLQRILKIYNQQKSKEAKQFVFYLSVMGLYLIYFYFKNFQLEQKIFGQGIFKVCNLQQNRLKPMFDSQVYENLEVFNIRDENDTTQKGTLFHYLNECITSSGQKLLRKWLNEPLRNEKEIKQRQLALKNIVEEKPQFLNFHKNLFKFESLQRRIGNIYHWAQGANQIGQNLLTKNMKFDKDYDQNKNPAVVRLKQIIKVLDLLFQAEQFLKKLSQESTCSFLKKITNVINVESIEEIPVDKFESIDGIPSIQNLVNRLKRKINQDEKSKELEPAEGENQVFDNEREIIRKIKDQLMEILEKWRKTFDSRKVCYVSVRARNQIQVPMISVGKKKFKELIFSSQTSKQIRYVSAQTNQLSQQLIVHEQQLARSYEPFLGMMVSQFCSYKHVWDLYITALSNIDVLMSLAKVSSKMLPRCLPTFSQNGINIQKGCHPGLLQVMNNVIGNDLLLQDDERVLILTGPNMGGKSTLLRQTCLLAIMSQIGCYVPAENYETIIFDQIFCRIGASDRIIQGKSTFFVELEETKRLIQQATPNSLVIIDELGRGTSTYDGMAIAISILQYIVKQIGCYTLFSTHYHAITKQFQNNSHLKFCKIGYFLDGDGQLRFTYQLEKGVAEKSFANNVAKLVGMSTDLISLAKEKAKLIQFEQDGKISQAKYEKLKSFIQ